jgi:hypothetical protein
VRPAPLLLALLLVGCAAPANVPAAGGRVEVESHLIAQGDASGLVRQDRLQVIGDPSTWNDTWSLALGHTNPTPPVDFTKHRVAAYGFVPTQDCSWLALRNVTRSLPQGNLTLHLEVHQVGSKGCGARNPWLFVEIPLEGAVGYESAPVDEATRVS